MPALPCAGSTYHYQGQECLPSLSLFPSFFPFPSHFPPCSDLHAGPWQRCREPINPLLTQLPRPHPSARLARSIRSFMGNLGPKAAHLEAPSHFLRLFPFCSVFVEDKGRRQRQAQAEGGTGSGGRAESQETKRLFSWKCPGKEAANLGKGEHRAGERSGGELSSALASRCGRSREKKENRAGSFPAGIGHCLKLWNTDIFFN